MYHEPSRVLFPLGQRGTEAVPPLSYKTGFQANADNVTGALLRLWVKTRTTGSITDLKIWVPRPGIILPAAADEFEMYAWATLGIAAAGVHLFTVFPGVGDALGNKKDGPFPPHYEVEVIQAATTDMIWQLDALWL